MANVIVIVIVLDWGGGVSQMLTIADEGGGATNPQFWLT